MVKVKQIVSSILLWAMAISEPYVYFHHTLTATGVISYKMLISKTLSKSPTERIVTSLQSAFLKPHNRFYAFSLQIDWMANPQSTVLLVTQTKTKKSYHKD